MGATNSTSKNTKYYSLKAKVDETNTPKFVLSEKNAEGKWVKGAEFDTMSGHLSWAKIEEKEFEGAKFKVFNFGIDDDNETSVVQFTHNSITHNFINSLASDCNKLSNYSIQVYKKQSKSKDGKMYWNGGIAVKLDGSAEMLKWSIDPQSAPKKVQVIKADGTPFLQAGKPVYDSTLVNEFWERVFNEKIASVLGNPAERVVKPQPMAENTNFESQSLTSATPADVDDLPF